MSRPKIDDKRSNDKWEMTSINQKRRNLLSIGLAAPAFFLTSCAAQPEKLEPIPVDVSGVTDVSSLIRAFKRAAGTLLPESIKDEEFLMEFARSFVGHARAAADNGYPIPKWLLDKLPQRKIVIPLLGLVTIPVGGVYFTLSVQAIIEAVIWSIIGMAAFIVLVMPGNQSHPKKKI